MTSRIVIGLGLLFVGACASGGVDSQPSATPPDPSSDRNTAAESDRFEPPPSPAEVVARIRAAVTEEAKLLGPDHWAGHYYSGDGKGVNLYVSIAPEAGFAFEWYSCTGLYSRKYGNVNAAGERLQLSIESPKSHKAGRGLREFYMPVRWSAGQCLAAPEEVSELSYFKDAWRRSRRGGSVLIKDSENPE